MCGFAVVLGKMPDDPVAIEHFLASRGPDGRGVVCDEHLWMLHRRLSVIDLTEGSAQPFFDKNTGSTTVYNGELYNYEHLRKELPNLHSNGDTEVFARILVENNITKARGMYAGVVQKGQSLTICRDRFGIKPLYQAATDDGIAVASQVRCFPAITGNRSIDRRGIASVLRFGSVVGCTMFEGVDEVPPGITTVHTGDRFTSASSLPVASTAELGSALRQSVERNLVADVPTAVLLSGGLDSAVLAKLAAESGAKPVAITLAPGGDIDETVRAARTAQRYGLEHVVEKIDTKSMLDSIGDFFASMDQPSIDGLNTFLVSRAVRRAGFKVALSGLGADELFGGYSSFRRVEATFRLRRLPAPLLKAVLRRVGLNKTKVDRWVAHRSSRSGMVAISREVFGPDEVRLMTGIDDDPTPHPFGIDDDLVEAEIGRYMSPMLLRDADAHSMAESVELRVPFLDDDVVGVALARTGVARAVRGKRAIAEALDDDYLRQLSSEPKTGFRLPYSDWIRGPLSDRVPRSPSWLPRCEALPNGLSTSQSWAILVLNEWISTHGV